MAILASTGLRNALLASGSLANTLADGLIHIYQASTLPVSADAAATGIRLCTISLNSTGVGINFDATAVNGSLQKAPAEIWSGVNDQTGTATYYRHVTATDDGSLSTTFPRLQGTIDLVGADMNLSSVGLSVGATQTLDYYVVTLPAV
jgi:hypothetical protein